MRELGEGVRRIFELMKNNDLEAPHFESKNKSFKVLLSQKHIYTKEEKIWLDNFEQFELSREQKTVVRLGHKRKTFLQMTFGKLVALLIQINIDNLLSRSKKLEF